MLIQQFDMILALNPGGNTFYFGPVGYEGSDVIKYFGDRGFSCPPGKNIAEFILETAAKSRRRADGTKVDWNEEWRKSEQAQYIKDEIQHIKSERHQVHDYGGTTDHEFASPVSLQIRELTVRIFRQYWRDPSYYYGKLFTAVIIGIFNGFTYWQLGNSIQDMQNRMFSSFLIITIPPVVVNAVVPKFFINMMLWQAREFPSRIYGWVAFCTAMMLGEIPIGIVSSVLYFLLWYFPAGLPYDSSAAGYVFLMVMLFFFFTNSWGQWITAFAPSFTVISNVIPFFFVMFSLFNGVVRPYSALPVFWVSNNLSVDIRLTESSLFHFVALLIVLSTALLDVLHQSINMVDRGGSRCYPKRHTGSMRIQRSDFIHTSSRSNVRAIRRKLRTTGWWLPHLGSQLYDILRILPDLLR